VRWGETELRSERRIAKNGRIGWYETLKRMTVYFPPSEDDSTLSDIFVYLRYDDDNFCYIRVNPAECRDPTAKAKWYQFVPDKAVGKVTNDWEGGFLRARIYIGPFPED
jgi:hypothetical protein